LRRIRNDACDYLRLTCGGVSAELLDGVAKWRLVSVLPHVGGVAMMA